MEEISIGEVARRSRLSLKALRRYDERGALAPSRADRASGYRYYDTARLDGARLVVMMRQLPLPPAAVKQPLAAESLDARGQGQEHEHQGERLARTPRDPGLRTTHLAAGPSDPGTDLAVPFAAER